MLLRIGVENYRSIFERQELSLIATSLTGCESSLLKSNTLQDTEVLPTAIMYGANASGKTNFFSAVRWFKDAVLDSHRSADPEGGVSRTPFLLSTKATKKPTIIDIDFVLGGIRYNYGFKATGDAFEEEWLYGFPHNKQQMLFERSAPQTINFGRSLRGKNKTISSFMRDNSLYLSVAVQNKHRFLTEVSNFISSVIIVMVPAATSVRLNMEENDKIDKRVINFLNKINTGIVGYNMISEEKSIKSKEFTKKFNQLFIDEFGEGAIPILEKMEKNFRYKMTHLNADGGETEFELSYESAGTQRLIIILEAVFEAIDDGRIVLIDELDASLHTQAAEAIVKLFSDPSINKNNAQLIGTTHDTNIMMADCLRRDQIWFAEKDRRGASHIYPLSDIKVRKEDNFEKGYLQGRFGAIPFANSMDRLMEKLRRGND